MTDRVNSLIVVLEDDVREDDVENWVQAIKMLRGVVSVTKNVSDLESHIAEERARHALTSKLWKVLGN